MSEPGRRGRPPHPDILTPAEWRVLDQVREGLTNAEIGERLGVSIHTVKFHVSNILSKLNLETREDLAAWDPRRPQRTIVRRLAGVLPLGKLAASWRVPVTVGMIGAGLAGAAFIASVASHDDSSPSAVTADMSPTAVPIPDATPSLAVTSFELTQHEMQDVRIPGFPSPKWETTRMIRRNAAGDTLQSTQSRQPSQPDRFLLQRGTTHWLWGPDLPVVVEQDLARYPGYTAPSPQLPGWPYGLTSLREIAQTAALGRQAELIGQEDIAGRPTYVVGIAADPCAGDDNADLAGPATLWIDKETLFVLKNEVRSRSDGRVTMLREVTAITYNLSFTDADFVLPTGVPINVMQPSPGSTVTVMQLRSLPTPSPGPGGATCPTPQSRLEFATPAEGFQQITFGTATPIP
ncbi:MAG TPA: LuxR C-terminal-related transcriptional regulator [Tepidiformaceae bacterium]|nr:LuxR C-terminal-related transcriptional regulator [Tepidiformaceae bacterium]